MNNTCNSKNKNDKRINNNNIDNNIITPLILVNNVFHNMLERI